MSSKSIWHPFTIQKDAPEPLKVIKGEGLYLHLEGGAKVMDMISSWWVNTVGHGNPEMAQALKTQAEQLEHVIFAGYTHDAAELLAGNVLDLLPSHFSKVFFSDNGSTSVEVALKMAIQYWSNLGTPRREIVAFEGSYHGDTFGAMAAAERSAFSRPFDELLFDVTHLAYPSTWEGDNDYEEKEHSAIENLAAYLERNNQRVAAVIIEPLVQGAGGMRMSKPSFLQKMQDVCHKFGVLQIYDEVMTGFGRTGSWFSCTKAGTQPDLICLSKALTGGYLPMALTIASDEVYASFVSEDTSKTFWHGHSYTANPLGCAAANQAIAIMKTLQPRFEHMEEWHRMLFSRYLSDVPIIRARFCGTLMAFDLPDAKDSGYFSSWGPEIKKAAPSVGLLLRPLGNTVYFLPPYVITKELLEEAYSRTARLIRSLL